nr:hypothetical protein [Frankia sp. ArI3]
MPVEFVDAAGVGVVQGAVGAQQCGVQVPVVVVPAAQRSGEQLGGQLVEDGGPLPRGARPDRRGLVARHDRHVTIVRCSAGGGRGDVDGCGRRGGGVAACRPRAGPAGTGAVPARPPRRRHGQLRPADHAPGRPGALGGFRHDERMPRRTGRTTRTPREIVNGDDYLPRMIVNVSS